MYYVAKDLVIVSLLYLAMLYLDLVASAGMPAVIKWCLTFLYWYIQGTMFWALFVLGHDCGHGSFSKYTLVNDIVGNALHSMIVVPYYPWKLSHRLHHKNTGNIDKDEIFYPVRENRDSNSGKQRHFLPLFGFGFGWFFYLVKGYSPRLSNHMNPWDPLFARNACACLISLATAATWLCMVLAAYAYMGWTWTQLTVHYFMPVFVFASWLVVTTFLHHQDEGVPWYADSQWDFVRGQLSSVDRHYGWAHGLVHNIGTHQIHHLFTKIPHYHLEEATTIFRTAYPELVRYSPEPILPAFLKMFFLFDSQQWIPDNTLIHVYRQKKMD